MDTPTNYRKFNKKSEKQEAWIKGGINITCAIEKPSGLAYEFFQYIPLYLKLNRLQ